jgi:LL-diaminopimelate aminotransferase
MRPPAQRLQRLPRYVFQELASLRAMAVSDGRRVIDLTVGNPDLRPPRVVVDALCSAASDPTVNLHRYSAFNGLPEFRHAISRWYAARFQVHLDPDTDVLPLVGSKEGLAHLMQAYLDPEDTVLVPTPCYPAYLGAARLAEARIQELPLLEENGYLVRFDDVAVAHARAARMLLLNYPHNPTGAVCDRTHYRQALAFCRDHDILLVSDMPYSELWLDDGPVPPSVLELPGALEQAVELQSLSKSHCMAGWRVGFCVGSPDVVASLAKLKANVDFSIFPAVQKAAAAALDLGDGAVADIRATYRRRRDHLVDGLGRLGWPVRRPPAGMYVWTRVPPHLGTDDFGFVRDLFQRTGVLVSPGSSFGAGGEGYVRMSLVVDEGAIDEMLQAIEASRILRG